MERGSSTPGSSGEPRTAQDISPQLDFLYRAESAFSAWVQFADAKAGGVTLLLGIGLLDLIRRSSAMVHAHERGSAWGWIATITFFIAIAAAAATIAQLSRALFPTEREGAPSLYYFGAAAEHPDAMTYRRAVEEAHQRDLLHAVAVQAWNLAQIATTKYHKLRLAYLGAVLFVATWAIARITLQFA